MNQHYLQAVEKSFAGVLGAMAGLDITQSESHIKQDIDVLSDDSITGVISLSSDALHFSVALTFPVTTITAIAQRMLPGIEIEANQAMVADLVGEIANMVVGGAKNCLDESGDQLKLSLPVVVAGKDYHVEHKSESPVWLSQFHSEVGDIHIESSYQTEDL